MHTAYTNIFGLLFRKHIIFEYILTGGYFFPVELWMLGLKNKPLVTEKAYRVSTSAYLVYGSLIPQIMETWGWMAALIRSKTNI